VRTKIEGLFIKSQLKKIQKSAFQYKKVLKVYQKSKKQEMIMIIVKIISVLVGLLIGFGIYYFLIYPIIRAVQHNIPAKRSYKEVYGKFRVGQREKR
jgi:hypothetical protein